MNRRSFLRFLGIAPVAIGAGVVVERLHSGGIVQGKGPLPSIMIEGESIYDPRVDYTWRFKPRRELVVEDGTGKPDADSFVSLEDCKAYHTGQA